MIAAFAGLTIATAVQAAVWWPFLVILAVTGFAYLFGLSTYSGAEAGPADDADADADAEHETRSPARS